MTDSLLSTKLFIPPIRQDLVLRQRLFERLNEGLKRKLTLISAPAGFGKTTLVSEWVNQVRAATSNKVEPTWISLDEGDNDPARFFSYLIAAFQKIDENIGRKIEGVFHSQQEFFVEPVLMKLINDISQIAASRSNETTNELVLILDDYHVIEENTIHQTVDYLLKYAPKEFHIVLTTRIDPPFSLSKLRVTNQMVEIRGIDLHFTQEEIELFLNGVMKLGLKPQELSLLESCTEGWIAGLQLAAISLQSQENRPEFIKAFSGSNRFVIDYLVDEVMLGLPEEIRRFIHRTSILDQLCAPLCDSVVNISNQEKPLNSQHLLEYLDRSNLFIFPLDNQRKWFRYHHLFLEAVRYGFRRRQPDQLSELHLKASRWYETQGDLDRALKHAIAAEDMDRAAHLVEDNAIDLLVHSQLTRLKTWFSNFSKELILSRPWLCIYQAWIHILIGTVEEAYLSMNTAETLFKIEQKRESEELEEITGHISTLKARIALKKGDIKKAVEHAEQAQSHLTDQSPLHAHVAVIKGLAAYKAGNLNTADHALREAVSIAIDHGHRFMTVDATIWLGHIKTRQGQLFQATSLYQEAIKYASLDRRRKLPGAGSAYIGMALIEREWNHLEKAEKLLLDGYDLCSLYGNSQSWHIAAAFVKSAKGEIDDALEQIKNAERFETGADTPFSNLSLEAGRMRLLLCLSDELTAKDSGWFDQIGLDSEDLPELSKWTEYSLLARFLVDINDFKQADSLLEKLKHNAETGDRNGDLIEILALQVLSSYKQGEIETATKILEKSLSLAESGGFLLTFLELRPSIEALLKKIKFETEKEIKYLRKLKSAYIKWKTDPATVRAQPLIEPLTARELEVLNLIAKGLTNRQIAARLYLSQNTVKVHTRNIFGKLGVINRTQAVAKAKDLELLNIK